LQRPDGDERAGGNAATPATAGAAREQHHVPTNFGRHTGRRLGIGAAVVAVVLFLAFVSVHLVRSHDANLLAEQTAKELSTPPAFDVVAVKASPPTQMLVLPGETRAWFQTTIYARVNGYVAEWRVDMGDRVRKGQVLATIETPELDDQLAAAKAKLDATQAEVTVAQSNVDFARSTFARWSGSPKGVVSEQEREQKKSEFDSSVARLLAAQAQVKLDGADVQRLTSMAQFKEVTAPFDGTIIGRTIDIGDLVTAGSTANTSSLYSIAQSDRIRVFVDVPQSASAGVRDGAEARVTASEFSGRVFEGTVARTARAIDPVSRTLRVEVDIPNADLTLLPGMYVQISFRLAETGLVQVPASALVFRTAGPEVAVVDGSGRVAFRAVTIGRDLGDTVEIATGLAADERVALNISSQINEGDKVAATLIEMPAPAPVPPRQGPASNADGAGQQGGR
jgi:RND family efflux transporter MFP subunit